MCRVITKDVTALSLNITDLNDNSSFKLLVEIERSIYTSTFNLIHIIAPHYSLNVRL